MIGMIIRNMRLSAGYSQKELGRKLNLADTTISSYERENSQADFDTILKIANICGYKLFFKDNDDKLTSIKDMAKERDF